MGSDTLHIGNVEILAVVDAFVKGPCAALFPDVAEERWQPFCDQLEDGCKNLPITITSFVVRSSGHTILIDTGIGAKDRQLIPNGRLPDAMADAGVRPEDVDIVVATHIHIDHVGWHTRAEGDRFVPMFPNARYVFCRDEFEFFTAAEQANLDANAHVRDCVLPLQDAANIDLVDREHHITGELTMLPTPGHTPAHSAIAIMSAGEQAVIIGDVCHHPAQMVETGWSPVFDLDPALAAETREGLMRRIEEERLTVIAGHFAHPGFGRLIRVEGRRTWVAI